MSAPSALLAHPAPLVVALCVGLALGAVGARYVGRAYERFMRGSVALALARLDGPLDARRDQAGLLLLAALNDARLVTAYERATDRPLQPLIEALLARPELAPASVFRDAPVAGRAATSADGAA